MATQEIVAVSQKSVQVTAAPKAHGKTKKLPPWRYRKNKLPASTVTEDGTAMPVTETKPKSTKPKKQKKAEGDGIKPAAEPANGVRVSSPPKAVKVTETTESKAESNILVRDEVTAPSAASGGVPEPTAAYLQCAALPPSRLARPRRILIVMDLNGTLLHRPNKRRPSHFVARPHARVFMDYLLANFAVAVWSSARPENVRCMVSSLLTPAQRARCVVVWGRDRFGLARDDYNSRVQCYKRLARVWADPAVIAAHPDAVRRGGGGGGVGGVWDQSNTVLVDDSTEKARSEPHNLLCIPEYAGPEGERPFVLPQVHDYINELAHQADISRYIRENPFQLDPGYTL